MKQQKDTNVKKAALLRDLRKLGIKKGDHLAVTLSLKSVGFIKGGPRVLIEALLECVGNDGTVMMNTFTNSFVASRISSSYLFDSDTSVANTGLVPEIFRKFEKSVRSLHPACSVTANGKLAQMLTADHEKSIDPYEPYTKLAKVNGKYLAIGLGDRLVAIRHEAQYLAGLNIVPLYHGVRYQSREGKIRVFLFRYPPCQDALTRLVPRLRKLGIIETGKVGMADSLIAYASELIEIMTNMLRENPAYTLCDKIWCLRCRELERIMNLYDKIENPMFFQRSRILRNILGIRNRILLGKFARVSLQEVSSRTENRDPRSLKRVIRNLVLSLVTRTLVILDGNRKKPK